MTAHPVTCLVENEDGYRTVITLEEPSGADTEMGATVRLRIMTDDGKTLQVGLSPEAAESLELRLRELSELHRAVGRCLGLTNCSQDVTEVDDDDE